MANHDVVVNSVTQERLTVKIGNATNTLIINIMNVSEVFVNLDGYKPTIASWDLLMSYLATTGQNTLDYTFSPIATGVQADILKLDGTLSGFNYYRRADRQIQLREKTSALVTQAWNVAYCVIYPIIFMRDSVGKLIPMKYIGSYSLNAEFFGTITPATTLAFGAGTNPVTFNDYVAYTDIVNEKWQGILEPIPPEETDPFAPGDFSVPGGGGGDFKDPSEDVTDPTLPDISAVDTGFITLFNPSVSQLNTLASYMWSSGFDLDTFKKMFANPMDCILGLSILPKIVPSGGSRTVIVGNISTGVNMTVAASQYVKFDCGSVTVKRYSNSFLDYAPYTKVSIYLPFIGIHELSVDDVMNKSVQVKYNIDILSGACVAFVICGGTTLYTYTGQCAASVPVTSGDWSNMINGVIGAVGGALKAAVGGAVKGGVVGRIGAGIASLASSAMDVAGMKPSIEHSGNMSGMGGMMGVKTPFLIITRPEQAIPGQQNKYTGYPAFITKKLEDLEGYTEIEEIHLENIPATENEITEIYDILKNGVIL